MKIGIVGMGKVGKALGKYFMERGLEVAGVHARDSMKGEAVAEWLGTLFVPELEELVAASDILFLTVVDGGIPLVWEVIRKFPLRGKILVHCSGALSSEVFSGIEDRGGFGYSLHPVMTLSDNPDSYLYLYKAAFTLEGSKSKLGEVQGLIETLGNRVQVIDSGQKALYHSAAVFASNFMVALAQTSMAILGRCGFDEESSKLLLPLMDASLKNIRAHGTVGALTGPVERNDMETVCKHLAVLDEEERGIYRYFSKVLIDIAEQKNPETDYELLKNAVKTSR